MELSGSEVEWQWSADSEMIKNDRMIDSLRSIEHAAGENERLWLKPSTGKTINAQIEKYH